MTRVMDDLTILYHLAVRPLRGRTHAKRMEDFYRGQAAGYDRFRQRLLHGRDTLFQSLVIPEGGVWVDFGGGTGANLESLGDRIHSLRRVYVVDVAPSLLAVAQQRAKMHGWQNVAVAQTDATTFRPPEAAVDVVTFSYSLTMIPDWFCALENARSLLKPGGWIGVVDFYVSRKHAFDGGAHHGWLTRLFWPAWFGFDNVFLSPDHLPFLQSRFETVALSERRGQVPYLPLGKVPYYVFVGAKQEDTCRPV